MDNLQSITYQTFEQDPVKYRNYEEASRASLPTALHADLLRQAIFRALVDWPATDRLLVLSFSGPAEL
jgi:hypothetical protein